MDPAFWRGRWERNEIGFHEAQANPLLVGHFPALRLAPASRIFVPLCGKTLDIHWLLSRGHQVAGAELSQIAVQQLFADLGVTPSVRSQGNTTRYSAAGIDIFQGDMFELSRGELGAVHAIYDRGALIALPDAMRSRYGPHLAQLTDRAIQLVITVNYDQQLLTGPPFSVPGNELARLYHEAYQPTLLGSTDVAGGLKGKCPATEQVWLLRPLKLA
ncbi:MAG TPA: thiopurine S-methyltransferase [Steroidobacteraceae bacterium]|nr:thiopurine S-methyltransferase [Steroidobacteraceae bacterium]